MEEKNMKMLKNKKLAILIATLLILSMTASMAFSTKVFAQVYPLPGTHVPSYAQLNVAPNPVGIGQTVTLNMYLTVPLETSSNALTSDRPKGFTITQTDANGVVTTLGPFTGDATGGTYTTVVPETLGNWTFQFHYPGQTLTGNNATTIPQGWGGLIVDPSDSGVVTLVVQQEPISRSSYPITPLPTSWWETPVTAENVQNWYAITGAWLGLNGNAFASTGTYNSTSYCNPYTASVLSGHVLWTLPWGAGGTAGGDLGGTESSNFWTTRQYSPNFAPVIINGILYSTQFTYGLSTGANNGIIAINLFTGQQLFSINTTNALRCGDIFQYKNVNQYGVMGPFLWTTGTLPPSDTGGNLIGAPGVPSSFMNTTGTQWNMYDGFDGRYILSIVNGTGLTISTDDNGGLVGYYNNGTITNGVPSIGAWVERTHPNAGASAMTTVMASGNGPHFDMFNFTTALTTGVGNNLQPARNLVLDWSTGVQFAVPLPLNISGVPIASVPVTQSLTLSINTGFGSNGVVGNKVFMTAGFNHGQGTGWEQVGWLIFCAMDYVNGNILSLKNVTLADTQVMLPFTRIWENPGEGKTFMFNTINWKGICYDLATGNKLWEDQLTPPPGYQINPYDAFNFKGLYANGVELLQGFGGDIWAVNTTNGQQMWTTTTNLLLGDPGIETPYGTWPLWVFSCQAQSKDVAYFAVGHEYDPPLFHGAQMLAINMTNGQLIWKELGTYTRGMAIAYGVLINVNAYDNQVYGFGKGPSATTVQVPNPVTTVDSPIVIQGTVTDVSAGASQDAIKRNFPNGLPAVSDESQSAFMEYVYQQQVLPSNTTGVTVTLSVLDANNNFRTIGTTTSDASGHYSFTWKPDIPGDYKVVAAFSGSNSYYGSSDESSFYASLPATHEPTATTVSNFATNSDLWTIGAAIIVVIVIIGVVLALLMMRKRA